MENQKMKTKSFVAALSLLAAGAVFAQQTEHVPADAGFVSSKTRAEVIAELKSAQEQGTYVAGGVASVDPVLYIDRNARADTALAGKASQRSSVQ